MKKIADVFSIGAQFIDYCINQGWIVETGKDNKKEWYLTEKGEKDLKKFNIKV